MLKRSKGNLIDMAEAGEFDIIVHGCNCQNTMGSGIAREIRERYPRAYEADKWMHDKLGRNPIELLGNFSEAVSSTYSQDKLFLIVNAYTQLNYLPRGIDHFEYESCLLILRKLAAIYPDKKFGFPYIGMGLAGGDSKRIVAMLESFAHRVTQTGGSVTLVEFA